MLTLLTFAGSNYYISDIFCLFAIYCNYCIITILLLFLMLITSVFYRSFCSHSIFWAKNPEPLVPGQKERFSCLSCSMDSGCC